MTVYCLLTTYFNLYIFRLNYTFNIKKYCCSWGKVDIPFELQRFIEVVQVYKCDRKMDEMQLLYDLLLI